MERNKALKQVYDLALGTARSWQNSQTGWIHYCYHKEDEEFHFTIPTYENFLFVLALMKSKVADHFQEAKSILEKLLHFQTNSFPVYLHEYPQNRDKWTSIQMMPVYAQIFGEFAHLLGETLKERLTESLHKLIQYTQDEVAKQPPPYHLSIKLGGTLLYLGNLFHRDNWIQEGESLLSKAWENTDRRAWQSPCLIGDMLIGLTLAYPKLKDSPWNKFWKTICESWSIRIGSFAGPAWKEYQSGFETETTLYDLYMSVYSGFFPYRAFIDHPIQLQGILIKESQEIFPHEDHEQWNESWVVQQKGAYTVGVMSKTAEIPESWEKGYVPFKILWGNLNRYRSLVMQGGNCKTIAYELTEKGIDLIIELNEPSEKNEKDKHREICFYTEYYEGDQLLVSGSSATTFLLRDQVTLHSESRHFQLIFQVIQGTGDFMGHIARGNRPSQINTKGKHRTEAFDRMIFLRSIRRTGTCRILVSFTAEA